jgi:hypothetical protein
MSSLYAQYIKEREDHEVLEVDGGFVNYGFVINEDTQERNCLINDIFVRKENRQRGIMSEMAKQVETIAKECNCVNLYGAVDSLALNANNSILAIQAYGMKLSHVTNGMIFFKKEL